MENTEPQGQDTGQSNKSKMKNKLSLMWVSNLFIGIIIGLSAGILGFIALGSILSFFSVPKPAIVYRDAKEWSLMGYLLAFYPIACMAMGAIAGGYFFGKPKGKKPD